MTIFGYDLIWTVATVLAVLNIVVSARVLLASGYSWSQKLGQCLIVWLVPLFGAIFVHSFVVAEGTAPKKESGFFQDGGNNPPGIQ